MESQSAQRITGNGARMLNAVVRTIQRRNIERAYWSLKQSHKPSCRGLITLMNAKVALRKSTAMVSILAAAVRGSEARSKELSNSNAQLAQNMQAELAALATENRQLKSEGEDSKAAAAGLKQKLAALTQQNARLKEDLDTRMEQLDDLQSARKSDLQNFKLYTANIEQIQTAFAGVLRDNQQLVDKMENSQRAVDKLKKQVADKEKMVEELEDAVDKLEAYKEATKSGISTKDEELAKVKAKLTQFSSSNSELKEQVKSLATKNDKLTKENQSLGSRLSTADSAVSQLKEQLKAKEEDIKEIEGTKLAPLNNKLEALFAECDELHGTIATKDKHIESLEQSKQEYARKVEDLEKIIHNLNKEKIDFYQQLSKLSDKLTTVKEEKDGCVEQIRRLTAASQQLRAENVRLSKLLDQQQNDIFNQKVIDRQPARLETKPQNKAPGSRSAKPRNDQKGPTLPDNAQRQNLTIVTEEPNEAQSLGLQREDTPIVSISGSRKSSKSNVKERFSVGVNDGGADEFSQEVLTKKLSEIKQKYNINS